MNTKIFVCCHKEFPVLKSDNIIPIQGGRKISNIKLNMIGDDTGDNISEKNKSWCELTVVNFHSKCKILGGVTEFFGKAFLCRFPPENLPRPVVYPVHSLPIQVTLGDS